MDECPDGLTAESAYYALGGPVEQVRAELRSIIAACIEACERHDTVDAFELAIEAAGYLQDLAD